MEDEVEEQARCLPGGAAGALLGGGGRDGVVGQRGARVLHLESVVLDSGMLWQRSTTDPRRRSPPLQTLQTVQTRRWTRSCWKWRERRWSRWRRRRSASRPSRSSRRSRRKRRKTCRRGSRRSRADARARRIPFSLPLAAPPFACCSLSAPTLLLPCPALLPLHCTLPTSTRRPRAPANTARLPP